MLNFTNFLESIFINKNLKRFLVLINISIFLSIFAATAAIISIFIEIEINKKETQMQIYQQELDFWRMQTSRLPLYITNADTVFVTDLNLSRKYKIYENLDEFDYLLTNRDFYYNRTLSLHRYVDYQYQSIFTEEGEFDIDETIDNLKIFYNNPDETGFNQFMMDFIDSFYLEFKRLESAYKKYADESKQIEYPTADEVFSENDRYDFYYEFHDLAVDRLQNWEDLLYIFESASTDAIYSLEDSLVFTQEEIKNLSNYEVWIIFIAFIIQVLVFVLIQFFEIGAISRERKE